MTTNFKKLVGWNLEEYNDMSDDGCLVCLTEKERYLLGQMTRQITWLTRWDNPENGTLPDLYEIQGRLDYKMSLQGCIDFCQEIIACIEDSESGVSNAILSLVGGTNYTDSRDIGQSQNDTILANGYNPTCDLDILFGQCLQIVEYMDGVNRDILEVIEVVTNRLDMLADVIGDITGIDESSLDAGISWIQFIIDSIAENYDAQITQAYLEEIACDLFCRAQDNDCDLTPTLLYDTFKDRLESTVTIDELIVETWLYLTSGTWTGQEIADFMFYSQVALRAQLGRVLERVAFFDINTRLEIYSNDPNPDWEILCDECVPTWEFIFDFREDDYDTYVSQLDASYPAVWTDEEGYVGGHDSLGARGGIVVTMPSALDLTFIESSTNQNITAANTRAIGWRAYDESPPVAPAVDEVIFGGDTDGIVNLEKTGEFDAIESIEVYCGSRQGASSYSKIEQLILRGTGDNPFI